MLIRSLLALLSVLLLAAIVWVTLETSPQMTTVSWIPKFVSRWADAEPTFRNFPPYALATLLSTLTALTYADYFLFFQHPQMYQNQYRSGVLSIRLSIIFKALVIFLFLNKMLKIEKNPMY